MESKKAKKRRLPMQHYPEAFKRKVCEEYLAAGGSKTALLKRYNIRYRSALQHWMRCYGYRDIHQKAGHLADVNLSTLAEKKVQKPSSTQTQLEARIKELEHLLEDEQLRSEAYSRMIDIAEKELKVPIRKKPATR